MADTTCCGPPLSFYFGMHGKACEDRILELSSVPEMDPDWLDNMLKERSKALEEA